MAAEKIVGAVDAQSLDDIYRGLAGAFERAVKNLGENTRSLAVGEHCLQMRFAGSRLNPLLLPAFEHLSSEGGAITDSGRRVLRLHFWDSKSSGIPLPVTLPEVTDDETAYYLSDTVKLAVSAGGCLCVVLNTSTNEGIFWTREPQCIPGYERAAPARVILHWWFAARGAQLVHAAAVAHDNEAVLLVGKSGSGKSTTSLCCMEAGFEFLGDDYCLIDMAQPFHVHSLFGSAKLVPDNLETRLPTLDGVVSNQHELDSTRYDKAIIFPGEKALWATATPRPIKAILMPEICDAQVSRLEPVSPMQALIAMAPSSLLQMPGFGQQALSELACMVKGLPCYRLLLGKEMSTVPLAVRDLWS